MKEKHIIYLEELVDTYSTIVAGGSDIDGNYKRLFVTTIVSENNTTHSFVIKVLRNEKYISHSFSNIVEAIEFYNSL